MTCTKLEPIGEELKPGRWDLRIESLTTYNTPTVILDVVSIDHTRIRGAISIDGEPFTLDLNFVEGDSVTFRAQGYSDKNPLLYLFVGSISQGRGKVLFQPESIDFEDETGLEGSWVAGHKPGGPETPAPK